MKSMNMNDRKGSLMIESMVAISITLISLLGVFALLSQSIALNKNASQKFVATYLAAEGIEIVRSMVDANYAASQPWNKDIGSGITPVNYEVVYNSTVSDWNNLGSNESTAFLNFDPATGIYSYGIGQPTPFVRTVAVTNVSGDEIRVVSTVNWSERGAAQSVYLEDHFLNWRP